MPLTTIESVAINLRSLYQLERHHPSNLHDMCMYQGAILREWVAGHCPALNGHEMRDFIDGAAEETRRRMEATTSPSARATWKRISTGWNGLLLELDRVQTIIEKPDPVGCFWTIENSR